MDHPRARPQTDADIDQIVTGMGTIADPSKINTAVLEALAVKLPPEVLADRVYRLVFAKRKIKTKDGVEDVDDVRANEAGLKLAYAYQVGKPVERAAVVTKNITADTDGDLAARLARSPALRRCLRKVIMEAGD